MLLEINCLLNASCAGFCYFTLTSCVTLQMSDWMPLKCNPFYQERYLNSLGCSKWWWGLHFEAAMISGMRVGRRTFQTKLEKIMSCKIFELILANICFNKTSGCEKRQLDDRRRSLLGEILSANNDKRRKYVTLTSHIFVDEIISLCYGPGGYWIKKGLLH